MNPFKLNWGGLVGGVKGFECFGGTLKRLLPRIDFDGNGDAVMLRFEAIDEFGDEEVTGFTG